MTGRFRTLLYGSTAGTLVLMLVGLYTGIKGAGLTCEQRWPLCDGWMGLFPATVPSFIEWSHRLLAMVVGFGLLYVLLLAWRRQDDRRVAWAVTAAVVLLPSQIILGALTVTEFTEVIIAAHFTTASMILLSLTVACAWTVPTPETKTLRRLSIAGLAAVPLHLALDGSIVPVDVPVLIAFYTVSFVLAGSLAAGALWAQASSHYRIRSLFALASLVTWFDMFVARRMFGLDQTLTDVGALVVFLCLLLTLRVVARRPLSGIESAGVD